MPSMAPLSAPPTCAGSDSWWAGEAAASGGGEAGEHATRAVGTVEGADRVEDLQRALQQVARLGVPAGRRRQLRLSHQRLGQLVARAARLEDLPRSRQVRRGRDRVVDTQAFAEEVFADALEVAIAELAAHREAGLDRLACGAALSPAQMAVGDKVRDHRSRVGKVRALQRRDDVLQLGDALVVLA